MNFGSFGAGFGAFGSGTGGLLPTITNLTSWIRGATEDGKTLPNSQGTDANLTGVNCIDSDNDDADNIDAQLTSSPTGDWYIEMTVYPQSFIFFQELVSINATNQYLRFNGTTGRLASRISGTSYQTSASNAIPLNEWSKVVCERSGSNLIYSAYELDGTQRFTETISAESTAFANDELIFLGVTSGRHFNGLVSDIKVGNSSTDLLCHYPLAEGSGTKAYDVSGKGNHGTITGTSWSTQNSIASWNHEYGFDVDSSVKVPALNTKTKQVATFDGVSDRVDFNLGTFNTSAWTCKATIQTSNTLQSIGDLFSQEAGTGTGRAWLRINSNGSATTFLGGAGATTLAPTGTFAANTKYDIELIYNGSNSLQLKTTTGGVTTTHTAVARTVEESTGLFKFFIGHTNSAPLSGKAFSMEVVGLTKVNFQNNVVTTTILDTSGNSNNGTVVNATLANFWGTRVADTSGSIVGADYANGNTSVSNPSGYTHNGSECGFDMVTNDLTSTQLFAIDNSTATQTFVRKNNGFITQVLDYSSALTGDELARTRSYVGS